MDRRQFLRVATAAAGAGVVAGEARPAELPEPSAAKLPRWRGFNLLEKFIAPGRPFVEDDFAWLAEWGFNFVRLPLSYRCWSDPKDWRRLNEAPDVPEATYVRVVRRLVEAIREQDAERLIIADGLKWGTVPVHGLADLKIAQSTRGYDPSQVSHYKASWVKGSDRWPEPT